jgi:hypothetical protein
MIGHRQAADGEITVPVYRRHQLRHALSLARLTRLVLQKRG